MFDFKMDGTALMFAANAGHMHIVALLTAHHAAVNAGDLVRHRR